jgi:uncharacterized protein YecT (DUF1311 family)
MTRLSNPGIAATALRGLLAATAFWTAAAAAQGVPASFDCGKAERAADRYICAHAALRWQDLALSRSYAAAKAAARGPARDALVSSQRDWLRERDRRCIADHSFKELSGPPNTLGNRAYACLYTVYLDRRRVLQDLGWQPAVPRDIDEIDLKPMAAQRPDVMAGATPGIAAIKTSPDGSMLAILLSGQKAGTPDQAWLYRVSGHKLVAATPKPGRGQAHPDGSPAAIESLAWQGDTLYARVATWHNGKREEKGAAVYAATVDGRKRLDKVPGNIQALLDGAAQRNAVRQDEVPENDQGTLRTVQGNHNFLVWTSDLGHGTVELSLRKRVRGSPAHLVAWSSSQPWSYVFDSARSQLIYAADTGITVLDMATHGERRIAGTSRGDLPLAVSVDRHLLVWSTRHECGDEIFTAQNEKKPQHFCIAHLPPLGGRK